MEIIKFKDYAELSEYLLDLIDEEDKIVGVVLNKEGVINLLRWLLEYENIKLGHIDIKDEIVDDYSKEYYFTLDNDLYIDIEPVYNEETHTIGLCCVDTLLLEGSVSSRIAIENDDCEKIDFTIEEDDNCDYDYEEYDCDLNEDILQAVSSALSFIEYLFED